MTLQDLKNNRQAIIETITEMVGADKVAVVMQTMVKGLDCCDTIEELIEGSISILEFNTYSKPDSRRTFILGQLAEMEIN